MHFKNRCGATRKLSRLQDQKEAHIANRNLFLILQARDFGAAEIRFLKCIVYKRQGITKCPEPSTKFHPQPAK